MKNLKSLLFGILLLTITDTVFPAETNTNWPKVIKHAKGDITVYQPTPETLDGTSLAGRAAVSVKLKESKQPVFGAIWITSTLVVDRDTRIATLTEIQVPNIRFSDNVDTTGSAKISKLIAEEMPKWKLEVSMDDLISTLESASVESGKNYKVDPPEIIISNRPAVLVIIDGKPILKELKGYDFQRVENSPFFIVFDPKEKDYYIYGDIIWFTSADLAGPWEQVKRLSSSLKKLQEDIEKANNPQGQAAESQSDAGKTADIIPTVIVRTTPAELVVITGEAQMTPITGTDLLYVKNTTSNLFMDIKSQSYFLLISGRWYKSAALTGPWAFVEANKLPEEFAKIPEGSEKDEVLASIAGTDAAKEAILDTQIPQTAEVDRKTATVTVEYDGEPKFEKVDGTSMLYAVNSPQTVLQVSNRYYCVDNGIWFESASATGPWKVADQRPEEVEDIEPTSSVYNVKYVYIYESTPEVVYVGYTPGYYGTYVYGPTVIYGTGYPYVPWYGAYYYPRPITWGFSMHYNPYMGWSMGFGVSYGPIHMSFGGGYYGGYYGCPGYHPPYHYPPHGGGYYGHGGYNPGYGGDYNPGGGNRPGERPGGGGGNQINNNMYTKDRAGVRPSTSDRPSTGATGGNRGASAKQQPNNIYTDKSGNVYQKTDKGWEQRQGNNWQSADKASNRATAGTGTSASNRASSGTSTRPSTGTSASTRPSSSQSSYNRSDLDRQAASRDRGTTRTTNSYSGASRASAASSRSYGGGGGFSGGGSRGGGRR